MTAGQDMLSSMLRFVNGIRASRNSTRQDHAARIARALHQARAAGHERVSPIALAKTACYSPGHFHQIYARLAGEPVGAFLRRRRLDQAALLLATTRRAIIDIALASGFESHAGFTRAFSTRFEIPPSVFRQRFLQARLTGRATRGFSIALKLKSFLHQKTVNPENS